MADLLLDTNRLSPGEMWESVFSLTNTAENDASVLAVLSLKEKLAEYSSVLLSLKEDFAEGKLLVAEAKLAEFPAGKIDSIPPKTTASYKVTVKLADPANEAQNQTLPFSLQFTLVPAENTERKTETVNEVQTTIVHEAQDFIRDTVPVYANVKPLLVSPLPEIPAPTLQILVSAENDVSKQPEQNNYWFIPLFLLPFLLLILFLYFVRKKNDVRTVGTHF